MSDKKIEKRQYDTPELSRLGSVASLTAGGSGNAQESSSGNKPRA
jgi:hypothetical protein